MDHKRFFLQFIYVMKLWKTKVQAEVLKVITNIKNSKSYFLYMLFYKKLFYMKLHVDFQKPYEIFSIDSN